jgi:hypothetical protein
MVEVCLLTKFLCYPRFEDNLFVSLIVEAVYLSSIRRYEFWATYYQIVRLLIFGIAYYFTLFYKVDTCEGLSSSRG